MEQIVAEIAPRKWLRAKDGWMDGCMDGWMDGWMNGWMDGWMDELVSH